MSYDLEIPYTQVKWQPQAGVGILVDDIVEQSVRSMFPGLEIINVDIDNYNPVEMPRRLGESVFFTMTVPRITVSFKHEHELTAARLMI